MDLGQPFLLLKRTSVRVNKIDISVRSLERKDDYAGGLIIAVQPIKRCEKLRSFCMTLAKPIVFVDDAPFRDIEEYPHRVSFVGVSSYKGGQVAAEALVSSSLGHPPKRVLIIASNSQMDRQIAFEQHLKKAIPDCIVICDDTAAFDRNRAEELARRYLLQAVQAKQPYDVVFCTSDPVALGCVDAVSSIGDWMGCNKPVVIGYDGIEATLKLTRDAGSPLRYVVIQDTHEIAIASVDHLVRLLQGENLVGPELIDPSLYPPLVTAVGVSAEE